MMDDRVLIAPSILSADFGRLAEAVRQAEDGGADWIHVDVMDGRFVPNLTVGPAAVAAVRKVTRLPLDVHLMVQRPEDMLQAFSDSGADLLTVHVEAATHLHRTVARIRELGARPGVSLNPATPTSALDEVVADVDLVLVMSVDPGFSGQEFIPRSVDKVARVRALLDQQGSRALLSVDGGVSAENARTLIEAGAVVLVAGASVYGRDGVAVAEAIAELREAAFTVSA